MFNQRTCISYSSCKCKFQFHSFYSFVKAQLSELSDNICLRLQMNKTSVDCFALSEYLKHFFHLKLGNIFPTCYIQTVI